MDTKGLTRDTRIVKSNNVIHGIDDIVLDKDIFSSLFEKDIRRVYLYKKAERLAKVLQLILPAFKDARSIKDRVAHLSVSIVEASLLPSGEGKEKLGRELLTLMSLLSLARTGGMLSAMNVQVITTEVRNLLADVTSYDEQKVSFEDLPSLASLQKAAPKTREETPLASRTEVRSKDTGAATQDKGHIEEKKKSDRAEAIISILKTKSGVSIKDISLLIRDVSEKTIQRELQTLVSQGLVYREGDRRWTTYTLVEDK